MSVTMFAKSSLKFDYKNQIKNINQTHLQTIRAVWKDRKCKLFIFVLLLSSGEL